MLKLKSKSQIMLIGISALIPAVAYVFAVEKPQIAKTKSEESKGEASTEKGPKPKLRVYTDAQKNVYWPMDLPFWVRLSTGPGDQQESFLLQNVTMRTSDEAKNSLKEGVRLEIPGSQFIRWMNHVSKAEVQYRFIADGEAPQTALRWTGAQRFEVPGLIYFGPGLELEVQAKDEHSGVKERYLSIDGAPFAVFDRKIRLDQEKKYTLAYYAVDQVGYEAKPKQEVIQIDLTPPRSEALASRNLVGLTLSQNSLIQLQSQDSGASIKNIYYKWNSDSEFRIYEAAKGLSLTNLSDGPQILKFFAEDAVGNQEQVRDFAFYLDKTAPSLAYTLRGDSYAKGDKRFISPRTQIAFDASDGQVKVKHILYALNKGPQQTYQQAFTPDVGEGEWSLEYQAQDELGNQSSTIKSQLIMDKKPPKSSLEVQGANFSKEASVIFLGPQARLVLKGQDDLAGVRELSYLWNEQAPMVYQEPISFPKEGNYLFRYWATDFVQNQEDYKKLLVISDGTGPEIIETFSTQAIGQLEKRDVYALQSKLSLAARDNASGLALMEWSIDDKKWESYDKPLALDRKGKWQLKIRARDQVGNRSEKTLSFEVQERSWTNVAH